MFGMGAELLDSSSTESITSRDQDTMTVLVEPEGDLGQVGALSDAVHAAEDDHIGPALPLGLDDIAEDVHATFRG